MVLPLLVTTLSGCPKAAAKKTVVSNRLARVLLDKIARVQFIENQNTTLHFTPETKSDSLYIYLFVIINGTNKPYYI